MPTSHYLSWLYTYYHYCPYLRWLKLERIMEVGTGLSLG